MAHSTSREVSEVFQLLEKLFRAAQGGERGLLRAELCLALHPSRPTIKKSYGKVPTLGTSEGPYLEMGLLQM